MNGAPQQILKLFDPDHLPDDTAVLGGKGKNLAFLSKLGVPVPYWVCVPSSVIEVICGAPPAAVQQAVAGSDHRNPESIHSASELARSWVLSRDLPAELMTELIGRLAGGAQNSGTHDPAKQRFYAVRSSALGEDSGEHSFAGQFETLLYVPLAGLQDAIVHCMASAYSERVLAYVSAKRLEAQNLRMAIIVQEMWPSERAGVLFTCNPEGRLDEMTVVAGLGLGEGVVSDLVESDQYTLDRLWVLKTAQHPGDLGLQDSVTPSIVSSARIAVKETRIVWDRAVGKGTVQEAVPSSLKSEAVLTAAQLRDLAHFGLIVEEAAGHPQDMEWGIDSGGQIVFLQTRPITTIPQGKAFLIDNSNVSESYPGVSSRLTFSVVRKFYQRIFLQALESAGVKPSAEEQNQIFGHLVVQVQGRIYYNLSNWYEMLRRIPGAQKYVAVWEEMLGIRPGHAPTVALSVRAFQVVGALRTYTAALKHLVLLNRKMTETHNRFMRTLEGFWAQDFDKLSPVELLAQQERLTQEVLRGWEITLWNDGFTFIFAALAKAALKSCGAADPGALLNDLLSGETEMESARSIASAQALAGQLCRSPRIRAVLKDHGLGGLRELRSDDEAAAFEADVAHHLARFGDRTMGELKLETETFRERPEDFVALLLSLSSPAASSRMGVAASGSPSEAQRGGRQKAEAALRSLLRNQRLRAAVVHRALDAARLCMRHRENSRFDRTRAYGMSRALFRALGRRLVENGSLMQEDHVFLYSVDELDLCVSGKSAVVSPAESLRRLALVEAQHGLNPEDRFWIRGSDPDANRIPQKRLVDDGDFVRDGVLKGVGSAAGKVTAECAVLTEPNVTADVRGKILVTRQTDPGWVFLMVNAAGLVSEKGSILSHTAIIGRELGVPTVVGVEGAAALLKSGDRVIVDGSAGTVVRTPTGASEKN